MHNSQLPTLLLERGGEEASVTSPRVVFCPMRLYLMSSIAWQLKDMTRIPVPKQLASPALPLFHVSRGRLMSAYHG